MSLENRIDESKSFMVSMNSKDIFDHRILDVKKMEIICVDSNNCVKFRLQYADGIDFMHKGTEVFLTRNDEKFLIKFQSLSDLNNFATIVVPLINCY